jgi:hypothetical protein
MCFQVIGYARFYFEVIELDEDSSPRTGEEA